MHGTEWVNGHCPSVQVRTWEHKAAKPRRSDFEIR